MASSLSSSARRNPLLALTFCAAVANGQPRNALEPAQMYKRVQPSVVIIEAYGEDGKVAKTGSGFIVSSDGRILTNYHVVQHCKQASVRLANGDLRQRGSPVYR